MNISQATTFIPQNRIDELKSLLKERLTEKRYLHSLAVADEAARLAEILKADVQKMYVAGLLHDICKNETVEQQLQLFSQFGIMLTDIEKASPSVWHAYSGALYIKNVLGIDDEDIISSVRYHTTGKADMTLSEKIIYIADLTEVNRDYPDVDVVRALLKDDIDKAIIYVLKYTLKKLSADNKPIHPNTLDAYNFLVLNSEDF